MFPSFVTVIVIILSIVHVTAESPTTCNTNTDQQQPIVIFKGTNNVLDHESFTQVDYQTTMNSQHQQQGEKIVKSTAYISPVHYNKGSEKINLRYVKQFLTPDEVQKLINLCEQRDGFQSSPVNIDGTATSSEKQRTSNSCPMIWPMQILPKIDLLKQMGRLTPALEEEIYFVLEIMKRISSFLKLPDETYIEPLQIVKYTPGQFYKQHHDHGSYYNDENTIVNTEQRKSTFLIFLSSVPTEDGGGHTKFNELDISVLPRLGDGIIWDNTGIQEDEVGEKKVVALKEALHEGSPPNNDGNTIKYALNVWIGESPVLKPNASSYRST